MAVLMHSRSDSFNRFMWGRGKRYYKGKIKITPFNWFHGEVHRQKYFCLIQQEGSTKRDV